MNGLDPSTSYGRLTIIREVEKSNGRRRVLCRCECGTERAFHLSNLRAGYTTSCGCLRAERASDVHRVHGHSLKSGKSSEYMAWRDMIARCTYERRPAFKDYGGRGIKVCERWLKGQDGLTGFECFLADMGAKPDPSLSLDRRDNEGSYEKSNCRWATRTEQNNNTRRNKKACNHE